MPVLAAAGGRESNSRLLSRQSNALTTRLPVTIYNGDLSVGRLAAGGRVLGQEVQLDAGQLLTGNAVARLPDELQFADSDRRPSRDATDDEELAQRQSLPRRRRRRGAVDERPVERVRTVMSTRRTRELTHPPTHTHTPYTVPSISFWGYKFN